MENWTGPRVWMKSYWQINNDIDLHVLLFVPQAIDIDYCHSSLNFAKASIIR
jgi:hypothetical protein